MSEGTCSGEIIAVQIDKKLSPQQTLEELFAYPDNTEKGLYNILNKVKNIKIAKLDIKNNFAIVTLSGDFPSGDVCIGQQMHDQIDKTLSQFDNIAGVDVFVGDEEISGYLSNQQE